MKIVGIDLTYIENLEAESGEEVFSLAIIKGLYNITKQKQITVFVLDSLKKQFLSKYPGLHVIGVKKGGRKFYKRILKKQIKKNPFDLIYYPHAHSLMNVKIKCKTAVTIHGLKSKKASCSSINRISKKLKKADYIVASSDFVKDELLSKNKKIPDEKITVINNPVGDIRQGVDIVLKRKFILSVNSDTEQKNLIAVVKAFNKIKDELPHDLVIIGTIDENGRVYRYIKKYGLASRVIITGRINRDILFGYYRNADLFVNASRYMGFGYTPIEALACGSKVLSTEIPSITAIPDVDCDGYIFNPHKYGEIANKILIALFNSISKEELDERAAKVKAFFSHIKAAEKYADLFEL
ncbi:MAG: glycosyltransferase [Clostridiales bacterium]|nr:glycosyltransferase [Clostridiales bacterium]